MPHVLKNEVWQVGLLPESGMSTAFAQVKCGGAFVDFMRPTPENAYAHPSDCASYLLVPWSNRIKDGHFTFRGKTYPVRVNAPDGSAIHGTAREYPWTTEHADGDRLSARFDAREHGGANAPFPFSARAEFRLEGSRFSSTLGVKNEGTKPMPAGFGHHPYFQRFLASADDGALLEIPCAECFELDACIPTGPPVPVDPRLDFRAMRPIDPNAKLDDCLTGRRAGVPIRFAYPQSGLNVSFELDPLFENVVVYIPPGRPYFAVEPVTNANDGFNLYERGIRGSGVFVLEPGEERSATFVLKVES
jgi:aldose 1-epimerase